MEKQTEGWRGSYLEEGELTEGRKSKGADEAERRKSEAGLRKKASKNGKRRTEEYSVGVRRVWWGEEKRRIAGGWEKGEKNQNR